MLITLKQKLQRIAQHLLELASIEAELDSKGKDIKEKANSYKITLITKCYFDSISNYISGSLICFMSCLRIYQI